MIDGELLMEVKRRFASGISITEPGIINLMEAAQERLIENAVVPIIEFFPIENPVQTPKKKDWHIFSPKACPNLSGLQFGRALKVFAPKHELHRLRLH